jgi:hypothetical protein
MRVEVTPQGAFYRPVDGALRQAPGNTSDLVSGVIWTKTDGGLAWIPNSVAMGDFGSTVGAAYWLNNQSAQLFSSFDTNPPTALWTDNALLGSTDQHIACANKTNTVVSLAEFNQNTPSSTCVLSKYTTSGTPDWTYTFAQPNINGGTAAINASFDSHAISGDGSVFAFGNFNEMSLWEKVAGVYTNTFNRTLSGSNYCGYIDISDDSKTVAYGFTFYDFYLKTQIEALDVPTHTVTMTDTPTSTVSSLQNIVSGVSISADGQRFAVGLWGDGSGPLAEARLYAKNQNTPVGTINLQGSVFCIAIAADGQRFAAGSKSVHANTFGNGGEVDLFGDNTPFTNYCFGNGSLATPCPCGNNGGLGHGCNNSSSTGGSLLTATGSTSPDTVVLTAGGELPGVLSIFLQGNANIAAGIVFGDGLRCAGGSLKRLYTKNASGGVVSAPGAGDPSITARSAALGDTIVTGTPRYYQVYYRDPVLTFCPNPPGNSWNVSNAVQVNW